ncbi:methylmalonyl-CoA epimerase [Aureimonas fodinaquatilis]|uniref:methylmalonyl-CoA epimerase n=1 Tax=Aureimonas fodinaquatilis TaxID=2565783 RepID=A0A5B0DZL8_9HYPH|nr:methylmalonyl-CoA epimerase [Aureimonas fodinaquatilis]KAA0970659.1 methylmalonyl-CoA epimerase [Aureimonas fodinaquatilis]
MIGRLNHVAIAVPNLESAVALYRDMLGAEVSDSQSLPEHGVRLVFVDLPNTRIELMEPLGEKSPIAAFLEKNGRGGIHHICYEVKDIAISSAELVAKGARVLGDGKPRKGAHGNPVLFLHPADFLGTLVELEEVG